MGSNHNPPAPPLWKESADFTAISTGIFEFFPLGAAHELRSETNFTVSSGKGAGS